MNRSMCRYCGEEISEHEQEWGGGVVHVFWLHTQRTHAFGAELCLDGRNVAEPPVDYYVSGAGDGGL